MSRKFLMECFDLFGLVAFFLAFTLAGCAPVERDELDNRRGRVTRSHPAQNGIGIGAGMLSAGAAAVLGGSTESSQLKSK
jgi:hypothetical protein